jgi:arylsulfatase A-like enzyme
MSSRSSTSWIRAAVAWILLAALAGAVLGVARACVVAVENGYFDAALRSFAGFTLQSAALDGARWGLLIGAVLLAMGLAAIAAFRLVQRSRTGATDGALLAVAFLTLYVFVGYQVNVAYLPHMLSATSLLANVLLAACFIALWWFARRSLRRYRARGGAWQLPSILPRVLLLLLAVVVAGSSALRYAWRVQPAGHSPNVLFVLLDAVRADRLGVYGYDRETSPNVDRLAREGWVFTNGIAQSSWTKPSMASIFTGLYVTQTSVRPGSWALADGDGAIRVDSLSPGLLTMTELLAGAGYRTAAFGQNHHLLPTLGFSQGFEVYDWAKADVRRFRFLAYVKRLAPRVWSRWAREPKFWSEWINDGFLDWLRGREDEKFFAYLHHIDVHWPYRSPPPFFGMFSDVESPIDFNRPQFMPDTVDRLRSGELQALDARILRAMSNAYDEGIRHVDDRLGRLFEELKQRGLYDNTLIIVTADHGEEFLEHGLLGHGESLYDEVIRVPLIVKFPCPGKQCGHRRIESQVELVDIFPTIMEVAGLRRPETLVGRSLLDPPAAGRNAFSEWGESVSLRTPLWKLIYDRPRDSSELYHLAEDPGETRDHWGSDKELGGVLMARLLDFTATHQSLVSADTSTVEADERMLENLRALGYVQ